MNVRSNEDSWIGTSTRVRSNGRYPLYLPIRDRSESENGRKESFVGSPRKDFNVGS